nr:hypothetical protein [Tanacetum cinerariifolium]
RTSSTSQSANKKQEFVKTDDKKVEKKDYEKKRDISKTKMLLAKKDKDEQVLLAEDQAWMELSYDSDQEINANMVFMAQIEKVLSESETSSSSADDKVSESNTLRNPDAPRNASSRRSLCHGKLLKLEPLMRRRMKELRMHGIVTHLNYSSEDVDEERKMEARPEFQPQPLRETEG